MISAQPGPLIIWGQGPAIPGSGSAGVLPPQDYNPDLSYSGFAPGTGLLDVRKGYLNGGAANAQLAVIFAGGGGYIALDQAPSAIATANIAALANATSGTKMTLVSTTGAGITVMTAAYTSPSTGLTVPSGSLVIDGLPGSITIGSNGSILLPDPRTMIARAVSITGVSGGAGGHFIVAGADLFGNPQTENITATSGATTTAGKKAFKFVYSVTPQFTDAHNYSIGTADVFGFPLRVDEFAFAAITWNNGGITANTGFVAADATSPATATTGDVRGTYATQSASDGTKKLQVIIEIPPWNAGTVAGVFGVTPA